MLSFVGNAVPPPSEAFLSARGRRPSCASRFRCGGFSNGWRRADHGVGLMLFVYGWRSDARANVESRTRSVPSQAWRAGDRPCKAWPVGFYDYTTNCCCRSPRPSCPSPRLRSTQERSGLPLQRSARQAQLPRRQRQPELHSEPPLPRRPAVPEPRELRLRARTGQAVQPRARQLQALAFRCSCRRR